MVYGLERCCTVSNGRNAKISEKNMAVSIYQHIFWFNIPVDEFAAMDVSQCLGHLFDVGKQCGESNDRARRVPIAECSTGGIIHDEIRESALDAEVPNTQNVWMVESREGPRFVDEGLGILCSEVCRQYLDGCKCMQVKMFCQIDGGKPSFSEEAKQPIVSKLLPDAYIHG